MTEDETQVRESIRRVAEGVSFSPPPRASIDRRARAMSRRRIASGIVAAAVLTVGVAAPVAVLSDLGSDGSRGASDPTQDQDQPRSLEALLAYFGEADYEPVATPAQLARQADLVVTGRIVAAREGQLYASVANGDAETATSVLEVRVDEVVSGDARLIHEGSIFIEVSFSAYYGTGSEDGQLVPFDHEAFAQTVPMTTGIFFVEDRSDSHPPARTLNQGAGRPPGAVRTATYAQGFLIEDDRGRLVGVNVSLESMPDAWQRLETVEDVRAAVGDGEPGNPMAPVGLDCQGGPAGFSSGFGIVGEGYVSGEDAAAGAVSDMRDLPVGNARGELLLVSKGDALPPTEEYVLVKNGFVVARVTVYEYHADSRWYVESTANCVAE